jgi:hypothetical protein
MHWLARGADFEQVDLDEDSATAPPRSRLGHVADREASSTALDLAPDLLAVVGCPIDCAGHQQSGRGRAHAVRIDGADLLGRVLEQQREVLARAAPRGDRLVERIGPDHVLLPVDVPR